MDSPVKDSPPETTTTHWLKYLIGYFVFKISVAIWFGFYFVCWYLTTMLIATGLGLLGWVAMMMFFIGLRLLHG